MTANLFVRSALKLTQRSFTPRGQAAGRCLPTGPLVWWTFAVWTTLALLAATVAHGEWLRPINGSGNFHSVVDLVNRWRGDETLDVVVMIAIANRELSFEKEGGRISGQVTAHVQLTGLDGAEVVRERTVELRVAREDESGSPALFQIFSVVLADVPFRSGRLVCTLNDENRNRPGVWHQIRKRKARSEAVADWSAEERASASDGLFVSDPIYLAHAPVDLWRPRDLRSAKTEELAVFDYTHPTRRYGLEQDHLQVYFEIWPPQSGSVTEAVGSGLLAQVYCIEPNFALRDTLAIDEVAAAALRRGERAGVFYQLDVNALPPGTFLFSVAPLGGSGRPSVSEFDVSWRLGVLTRHAEELLGEGRTVFRGDQLDEFLAATAMEREVMLEKFWRDLDPDPETPVNAVYLEFRARVAHVRKHLGGFGKPGALDPRGEVYLLLGPPDGFEFESTPMNPSDQDDARIKVYKRYAPDRPGTWAKGEDPGGTQTLSPYNSIGGIPMPYSRTAESEIHVNRSRPSHYYAFELWEYENAGRSLFENQYTGKSMGLRFLFIDNSGSGAFVLESTNAHLEGD